MIDLATITAALARDRVPERFAGPAVSAAPPGHHDKVTHQGSRGRVRLGRRAAVAVVALAALAISASVAMAATAGDLDPSFDGDGKRVLPYSFTPAEVLATPDGRVVLVDSESSTSQSARSWYGRPAEAPPGRTRRIRCIGATSPRASSPSDGSASTCPISRQALRTSRPGSSDRWHSVHARGMVLRSRRLDSGRRPH